MGNSSSASVSNINHTLVMNQNNTNILNKNINNSIANTIINDAKKCSAAINQLQGITFQNINVGGDFDLNANQEQSASLTFSCLQESTIRSEIANTMMQEMLNGLQNNNSSDIMAELEAKAAAAQTTGALSTAFGNSTNSNTNNAVIYQQFNTTNTNLKNIIENTIQNNFTTNNISDCIAQVQNNQNVSVKNANIGGNIRAVVNQKQAASAFTDCIQSANVGQKITSNLATELGVKVENTNTVRAETKMSGTSETTQKNEGLDILGSLTGSLLAILGPILAPICSCICCCILCGLIYFIFKGKDDGKDDGKDNGDGADQGNDK
jgi:hypothetical protein